MLRYLIISILIYEIFAKLGLDELDIPPGLYQDTDADLYGEFDYVNGEPLWVLSLKDYEWMAPKLRLGSAEDMEEFYYYILPKLRGLKSQSQAGTRNEPAISDAAKPNDNSTVTHESNYEVQQKFLRMINKFTLTNNEEPDVYLDIYDDTPSLELYFKGPHTACIVRSGQRQWNYVIRAKWNLPPWFYEKHDTMDSTIAVPEKIINEFYKALLHYLEIFFSLHKNMS